MREAKKTSQASSWAQGVARSNRAAPTNEIVRIQPFPATREHSALDDFVAVVACARRPGGHRDGPRTNLFSGSPAGHPHKAQVRVTLEEPGQLRSQSTTVAGH